jgi:hypothetical protein
MNERRSIGRTRIAKTHCYSLPTNGRALVRRYGHHNQRRHIRTGDLAVLPLNFDLSLTIFRTIRRCRLVWRDGDFLGVAFDI